MNETTHNEHLIEYVKRLADDALILGHRISEWCSHAPFLEEDIALANVALDYIGRSRLYYQYAAALIGDDTSEDDLAYMRDQRDFHNLLIVELPRGNFAYSMVRQLTMDAYNTEYLDALRHSRDTTLAAIAEKASKETRYHLRRSRDWILRLGDGTPESHDKTQAALEELWGYTHELFDLDPVETALLEAGIAVDTPALKARWLSTISTTLEAATLTLPEDDWAVRGGRTGYHTENLGHLLTDMQSVHRAYPGQQW